MVALRCANAFRHLTRLLMGRWTGMSQAAPHRRPAAAPRITHAEHPSKPPAYNCSLSFNWRKHLEEVTIARFQRELALLRHCAAEASE
jgi:isocitrate lyase